MKKSRVFHLNNFFKHLVLLSMLALFSACGGGGGGDESGDGSNNNGPWLGSWVQVNFLTADDNGVFEFDDLSGIGFTAKITENEWVETDDLGMVAPLLFPTLSIATINIPSER